MNLHWKCMNFYELFYIVVYEAIKINQCTHSYQLFNRVSSFWFCQTNKTYRHGRFMSLCFSYHKQSSGCNVKTVTVNNFWLDFYLPLNSHTGYLNSNNCTPAYSCSYLLIHNSLLTLTIVPEVKHPVSSSYVDRNTLLMREVRGELYHLVATSSLILRHVTKQKSTQTGFMNMTMGSENFSGLPSLQIWIQ